MQRFTNFSGLMSNNSNDDEEEEVDEEKKNQKENELERNIEEEESDKQDNFKNILEQKIPSLVIEVDIKEERPLQQDFLDSSYWKMNHVESSLDDLIAEMS